MWKPSTKLRRVPTRSSSHMQPVLGPAAKPSTIKPMDNYSGAKGKGHLEKLFDTFSVPM